ncbi:MAG: hypothetical protein LRS43_00355 [Desulfurococcales archaeon]|nr:hypothetical protein [Desulfurococcales archaeon]
MRARALSALLVEASSNTGLLVAALSSIILSLLVYPDYATIVASVGGATSIPASPESLVERSVDFYLEYIVRDDLALTLAVAAPVASGLAISYPWETGTDRFGVQFLYRRRAVAYASKASSTLIWLILSLTLAVALIPLSLSYSLGALMLRHGLDRMAVLVATLSLLYGGASTLISSTLPRFSVSIVAGIVAGFALSSLAVDRLDPAGYSAAGLLLYLLGYIGYLRRDL